MKLIKRKTRKGHVKKISIATVVYTDQNKTDGDLLMSIRIDDMPYLTGDLRSGLIDRIKSNISEVLSTKLKIQYQS